MKTWKQDENTENRNEKDSTEITAREAFYCRDAKSDLNLKRAAAERIHAIAIKQNIQGKNNTKQGKQNKPKYHQKVHENGVHETFSSEPNKSYQTYSPERERD